MDVIKFAHNKAMECSRSNDLVDTDSACLLWDVIVLLCRQNGVCVCQRSFLTYWSRGGGVGGVIDGV